MVFDPAALDLGKLFVDPGMFASRDSFRRAGFKVLDRSQVDKVMVASHDAAPGYLFKKYRDAVAGDVQRKNYEQRIEGVGALSAFVASRGLRRIALPQKRLCELPPVFGMGAHVLVVERLNILDEDKTKRRYRHIDKETLRELCLILHAFREFDSVAKNLPFTEDRRIAFIDTEHWNRKDVRSSGLHIHHYLSDEDRKRAKKIFKRLNA